MRSFKFKWRFSIVIIVAFILFTIIGTLTHELGHIVVAKSLGYDTVLTYRSMSFFPKGYLEDENVEAYQHFIKTHRKQLQQNTNAENAELLKPYYQKIEPAYSVSENHSLLVSIGGPAETILTCFLGLLILMIRKSKQKNKFKFGDWLGVFLGLFILREIFNMVTAIGEYLFFSASSNFSGDEFVISRYFGLNQWLIPLITMVLGLIIAWFIIFKVIPKAYRLSFVVAGFIGGILGFSIWFGFLGEMVLSN